MIRKDLTTVWCDAACSVRIDPPNAPQMVGGGEEEEAEGKARKTGE